MNPLLQIKNFLKIFYYEYLKIWENCHIILIKMSTEVPIQFEKNDNEMTFIISGAIDIYNEKSIKTKILDSLSDDIKSVVLDMSQAKTIDSSGICMLIILKNQLKKTGRTFALKAIRDTIGKIFQDTLFEKLFKVID